MVFLTRSARTTASRPPAPVEPPQQSTATRVSANEGERAAACSYWVRRRRAQGQSANR